MAMENGSEYRTQNYTIRFTQDGEPGPNETQSFTQSLPVSSLDVVPSPCHNGNGRTKPASYHYTSVRTAWPRGQLVRQYEYGRSVYQIIYEGDFGTSFGAFGRPGPRSQEDTLSFRALSKLYDKIKSSEVSLNTSIGEGRETLEMMRDIARTASRVGSSLKKLKRDLLLDPLQTVGSLYLGWSVGLAPLLNDCENIRNHMANADNDQIRCRPVSARASSYDIASYEDGSATVELSQRLQYGVRWRLSNLHLFENWRLGLTARPTLVWELVTLSFVVDYVISIGQYLELLEASMLNNGVEFIDGYRTFTQRRTEDVHHNFSSPRSGPPSTTISTVRFELDAVQVQTQKQRTVMTSFPSPPLPVVKLPRASEPLLNVAALLSQFLTRRAS